MSALDLAKLMFPGRLHLSLYTYMYIAGIYTWATYVLVCFDLVVLGTENRAFTDLRKFKEFISCPTVLFGVFFGGRRACLPAPVGACRLPAQGLWVNAFASTFLGTVRLEMVHFQRIIVFRGEKNKSAQISAQNPPSAERGARAVPAEPSPVPPPGAGVAAAQDNAYLLSLITRFFRGGKKKSRLDPRLFFMIQSDKTEHMLV